MNQNLKKPNPLINYDLQAAEHCCHIWKELTNLAMVTPVFSGSNGCLPPLCAFHCGHSNYKLLQTCCRVRPRTTFTDSIKADTGLKNTKERDDCLIRPCGKILSKGHRLIPGLRTYKYSK